MDAHEPFRFTCERPSARSEQPAPSSSGITRLATSGASVVPCASIDSTRPRLACSTTTAVASPMWRNTTSHGPRVLRHLLRRCATVRLRTCTPTSGRSR
eukprot:scaffold84830_cov64-Phaeocystis_antarctica.AAC.5